MAARDLSSRRRRIIVPVWAGARQAEGTSESLMAAGCYWAALARRCTIIIAETPTAICRIWTAPNVDRSVRHAEVAHLERQRGQFDALTVADRPNWAGMALHPAAAVASVIVADIALAILQARRRVLPIRVGKHWALLACALLR